MAVDILFLNQFQSFQGGRLYSSSNRLILISARQLSQLGKLFEEKQIIMNSGKRAENQSLKS